MKLRNRTMVIFSLLSILGVLAVSFPDRLRGMGLDFWHTQLESDNPDAVSRRLDALQVKVLKRNALKKEVVENLIADRVTLAQATEQFLLLTEGDEAINAAVVERFPAKTLEESTRMHVIATTTVALGYASVAEPEEILGRLRAEARRLKANQLP